MVEKLIIYKNIYILTLLWGGVTLRIIKQYADRDWVLQAVHEAIYGFIDGNIENVTNNKATYVRDYAFYQHQQLISANISSATSIGNYSFYKCPVLTTVDIPQATNIGTFAFKGCSTLVEANYPLATTVSNGVFDDNVSEAEGKIKYELYYHSVLGDAKHNGKIPESKWIASPRGDVLHKEDDDASPTWGDLFPEYEFVGWETHEDDSEEVANLYAIWEKNN